MVNQGEGYDIKGRGSMPHWVLSS